MCKMAEVRLESSGRRGVGSTAPTLTAPTCKEVEMADQPIKRRRPRGQSKKGISGRFWERVSPEPMSGCWIWDGSATAAGYGTLHANGRPRSAHRVAYEMYRGRIPDGLELDHKCRNTFCVNPDHLDAVPHAVNVRRGHAGRATGRLQRAKTHCPGGHEYNARNTHIRANGERECSECTRIRAREYQRRKRAAQKGAQSKV